MPTVMKATSMAETTCRPPITSVFTAVNARYSPAFLFQPRDQVAWAGRRTAFSRRPTTNNPPPTFESRWHFPMSDIRIPTSDFQRPPSDFRLPTSDVQRPPSDVRSLALQAPNPLPTLDSGLFASLHRPNAPLQWGTASSHLYSRLMFPPVKGCCKTDQKRGQAHFAPRTAQNEPVPDNFENRSEKGTGKLQVFGVQFSVFSRQANLQLTTDD